SRSADQARDVGTDRRQRRVEAAARALGRGNIAVAGNIREGRLQTADGVRVERAALRVDPVARVDPGDQALEGAPGGRRRILVRERTEERDPDRARVVALRVRGGDAVPVQVLAGRRLTGRVLARVPALVDVAGLVDQEVVADVAPALGDGVVVVDRPDRRGGVRVAVLGGGVVDDHLLHWVEGRRPDLLARRAEAPPLLRTPSRPGDDGPPRCRFQTAA